MDRGIEPVLPGRALALELGELILDVLLGAGLIEQVGRVLALLRCEFAARGIGILEHRHRLPREASCISGHR